MLEDNLHAPLSGGDFIDRGSANIDDSVVRLLQTCNEAEQRGLATPARPDDDKELPCLNVQADPVDRFNGIEVFGQAS